MTEFKCSDKVEYFDPEYRADLIREAVGYSPQDGRRIVLQLVSKRGMIWTALSQITALELARQLITDTLTVFAEDIVEDDEDSHERH